jgi:hypothetical protein
MQNANIGGKSQIALIALRLAVKSGMKRVAIATGNQERTLGQLRDMFPHALFCLEDDLVITVHVRSSQNKTKI